MTKKVKWPKGKTTAQFEEAVKKYSPQILEGAFVSVDPASRRAGYARFYKAELVESGSIELPSKQPIHTRLRVLYDTLFKEGIPDLLAIEKIRGARSHVYLLWAVGVSMAAVRAPIALEVPISYWKAIVPEGYVKTDEGDAELIGKCLIMLARELQANEKESNGKVGKGPAKRQV